MIVVLKSGVEQEKQAQLIDWLSEQGLQVHISQGEYQTVLGLVGDTSEWTWTSSGAWASWTP